MRDVGIVLKSNITIDRPANARGASRERNTVVAVFAQKQGFLYSPKAHTIITA